MMTREEAMELEIVELQQDYDDVCEYIHEYGGCEWCEQHCKEKKEIGIDRDCIRKYVDLKYLTTPEKEKPTKIKLLISGECVTNLLNIQEFSSVCDSFDVSVYTQYDIMTQSQRPCSCGLLTLYGCDDNITKLAVEQMKLIHEICPIRPRKFNVQLGEDTSDFKPRTEYISCSINSFNVDKHEITIYFEFRRPI